MSECLEDLPPVEMNSIVWLMYSSGTTGVSKGQVHTHRSVIGHLHHITYRKL